MSKGLALPAWAFGLAVRGLLLLLGACSVTAPSGLSSRLGEDAQSPVRLECPPWAQVRVPLEIEPYCGRFGLPDPYPGQEEPIGVGTAGIDFWQANHFVVYRPETARFLYGSPPNAARYRRGTLPVCEALADRYLQGVVGQREKAIALLTRALPAVMRHPGIPPLGPSIPGDRNLDEDALIKSGNAFCNEQARVFVQLCHYAGIPARMVFLFYSDKQHGHVVAEFHADGRWCLADASWFCVFPGPDDRLMSAAECHQPTGPNRLLAGQAYYQRVRELLGLSDQALVGHVFPDLPPGPERERKLAVAAREVRAGLERQTPAGLAEQLWAFGLLDYPPRP